MATYPSSHDAAHARVMQVIDLFGAKPELSDEEAVAVLMQNGVGEVDAELLIRFVPIGLSFALLKLLGLTKFPSIYKVKNTNGHWVELPLASEHYFAAALCIGYEVSTQGYTERVSQAVFTAVTMRSAEMNAVNQYFESGGTRDELAESTLGPPAFIGLTAEQIAAVR